MLNWKKWFVLFGSGLSSMLVAIDFTIVNTSLVAIQKSLSASISDLQWYVSAFGIPFCVLLVIFGRLADLVGRRLIMYTGMIGFGLGSVAAGMSSTSLELICARFFLGICGAAIFPCGMALTADVFPKKEHGKALGIYFSLLGIGLAIGPVIGGLITSTLGWNWIFFINTPVIVLSFLLCLPSIGKSKLDLKVRIDWKGFLLLLIGLSSLVTWITEGSYIGWLSPLSLSLLAIAIIFLWVFYRSESKSAYPMIPFKLFQDRSFIIATFSNIASISSIWAVIFIIPIYLQTLLNYDETKAGIMILLMTAMTVIIPPFAGSLLDKKGPRRIIILMFSALIVGYVMLLSFTATLATWQLVLALLFLGLGWGSGNGIGGPIVLSGHSSSANAGLITGAATTILNIFGVLILAQASTLLRFGEKTRLSGLLEKAQISLSPSQEDKIFELLPQPQLAEEALAQFGNQSSKSLLNFFKEAFAFGFQMSTIFLLILTLILFGLILWTLALKRKQKRA